MIFQLPTGKAVHISIDAYLNLTDEDVQYLIATGEGVDPRDPFHGSKLKEKKHIDAPEIEAHDTRVDFNPESEDESYEKIDINNIPNDSDPSNF